MLNWIDDQPHHDHAGTDHLKTVSNEQRVSMRLEELVPQEMESRELAYDSDSAGAAAIALSATHNHNAAIGKSLGLGKIR
jgi:hypothetical protein